MMLASFLADNFDSVSSIDWGEVTQFKEFSGHTERSLRHELNNLKLAASYHFKTDRSSLTLKQIAEAAKVVYSEDSEDEGTARKIPESKVERQMEIIQYWESQVENDIM